mgnify:CR=1 FL=1
MCIRLRTLVLLSALIGTGLMVTQSVQAAEKAKGKSEVAQAKTTSGASPTSRKVASAKNTAKPVVRTASAAVPAKTAKASGRSLTRQGGTVPALASGTPKSAKTASGRFPQSTRVTAALDNGAYWRIAQKRPVHRVLASSADLWQEPGQLAVHSGSALVVPQDGGEPLYEKNANVVMPIASITKVMTAMVVLDSLPNLQAPITITDDDVDYLRGSRSRLHVGSVLSRETALLLALMSSENRAAHALARHYPGGLSAFVAAMNRKAASLGMSRTQFEDPTGLSSNNVSTAHDLARMVAAAHRYPLIREFSTTSGAKAEVGGREIGFHNTNQLVSSPTWDIGLSKTGYIQEAGKCLVMQARVADRPVVIVLLDSTGKQTRIGDANRIKRWMESASLSGRTPTRV